MKSASSSLHGFMLNDGTVIKDGPKMCEEACKHYEEFFSESEIFRPHPYTDSPDLQWENFDEEIPLCTTEEVIDIVNSRKKKKSIDAHGLSNFTFNFLPLSYWSLLVEIFNHSFSEGTMPDRWKDSRMLLLAKKDPICNPGLTRPISLLDVFLKVNEKLFQTRFMNIVNRRGLLPDTQSGFRPKFRLQTRVLLFFEHISSLMANSSPVGTIFVDFRSAFDQLWFRGCIGKLKRMGIPRKYLIWIENWLMNRRAFIAIKGERSKWFRIRKGGPQGSIFTPLLFITYHSDLTETLNCCLSHHFTGDLAAIMGGGIGLKYSLQCLELEKKLSSFFKDLKYYCTLTAQPINYNKTQALFSARAIGYPDIALKCGNNKIEWVKEIKYLGYVFTPKLGFSAMIQKTMLKVRQRVAMVNSFRLKGFTSTALRKALFNSYVLPVFAWLFPFFPLFTVNQQQDLNEFYTRCLRRVMYCMHWNSYFFMYATNELSLEDRCKKYWERYWLALADTTDGLLIFEQGNLNVIRENWLRGESRINGIHRSKRYVEHTSLLEKCTSWCANIPSYDSNINYELEEVVTLYEFPETF
ncbi:unnamed protein product [Rotaria socialis]|uniref:Reverse transcriptase domain-containing protein n=2 Tax=Rotaria socialis TaxID=392032 RepID=A0A817TTD6_9BILA|nr:unnamed protein product [Rotaria socialis]CAF3589503.1 unnamed protein product [Rotaria socialis]CAF4261447.1 unnamed protein product [Rotaria socialis]CAF4505209.1 unnamed protein product [Rotaria socialis]